MRCSPHLWSVCKKCNIFYLPPKKNSQYSLVSIICFPFRGLSFSLRFTGTVRGGFLIYLDVWHEVKVKIIKTLTNFYKCCTNSYLSSLSILIHFIFKGFEIRSRVQGLYMSPCFDFKWLSVGEYHPAALKPITSDITCIHTHTHKRETFEHPEPSWLFGCPQIVGPCL